MNLSEWLSLGGIIMTTFVLWLGREKLKLTARYSLYVQTLGERANNIRLTWDVVNMSKFGVYIKSVGFASSSKYSLYSMLGKNSRYEIPAIYFDISGSDKRVQKFPIKLDAQEAITFTLKDSHQIEQSAGYKYLYVSTNSGYIKTAGLPMSLDRS